MRRLYLVIFVCFMRAESCVGNASYSQGKDLKEELHVNEGKNTSVDR